MSSEHTSPEREPRESEAPNDEDGTPVSDLTVTFKGHH